MSQVTPLPITPPPGVVVTEARHQKQGRWTSPFDKIRFVNGLPQKVGGNIRVTNTAMSGTPRAIHAWRDFSLNQYLAAGTYRKLYAFDSSYMLNDITPYTTASPTALANNPFTTVSGLSSVTVHEVSHNANVGDTAIFAGATTFNNVTISGSYVIQTVTDADNYVITSATQATANGAGGGAAVTVQYEIPVGTEQGAYGQGWGVGQWGLGTWGTARSSSAIFIEPRIWSLDHFGKILLASYNGGSIYTFDPTSSQPWARAAIISAAPTDCRAMFVTPERFVFALRDQMVLSSCSQGDYTTWTPSSSNTAFSRTLQEGTKLVGGKVLAPFVSLVWSDSALFLFQYTGSQFVYNSSLAGKDCGLISPQAAVTVDGIAYWMGSDNFYIYNGAVSPMPRVEEIRKYVFDSLPDTLAYQCHAVYIPKYHEVWFFYATTGDSNPTHYVIYHINDQCWSIGTFSRSSGTHFTQGDTSPLMASDDGYVYNHDFIGDTYNDNGSPMPWELTLSPMTMQEGYVNSQVEGIIFDFFEQSGTISGTINTYDHLNDTSPLDSMSDTLTTLTGISDYRLSGRYLELELSSSDLDSYMRLGRATAFIKPIGRRR